MLFDLIRSRDSLMCKREAREVKLFNRWICCTFHAAGSCVQCLSLVYLVSLLVMGTCSGLPTAARSGDSQSFTPQVKSSFWGEAPMGDGCGEKWGESWHVRFCTKLKVWDCINDSFFCCFPFADDLFKVHKLKPNLKWRQAFDNYLKTMPPYYLLVCSSSHLILRGLMAGVARVLCIIPLPSKVFLHNYDGILGS